MGVDLEKIDRRLTRSELQEHNIKIQNISATFSIAGEFDIKALSETLPNSEYKPDKHRSLIYRPPSTESLTILLPKSGRATLTGATSKDEIVIGVENFQTGHCLVKPV